MESEDFGAAQGDNYESRHREMLLPVVRVRANNAGGSGTIIYSEPDADGEYSTYVLTNHHVVDGLIKVEEKWSTLLKKNVKMDVMSTAEVQQFTYRYQSRAVGASSIDADVVAYDKEEDLALLHLRAGAKPPAVAKLFPMGHENKLRLSAGVFAVGAGLGESPVITDGMLAGFGREMENREFWISTAPTIFGNSGGALFLASTHELIGVPARVAVTMAGFSAAPITHLSYAIPITRVYKFLEDQMFNFIFDSAHTEVGDAERRASARKREEREMAGKQGDKPSEDETE